MVLAVGVAGRYPDAAMNKPTRPKSRTAPEFLRNVELVFNAMDRKLKHMSQTKLARECGLSVQSICDVVKRRRAPSERLLDYLGFEGAYVRCKPKPPAGIPASAEQP